MANNPSVATGSISAENTFTTDSIIVGSTQPRKGFNLSISGTWVGTVTVQRSFDGGSTWLDVDSFTSNVETFGTDDEHDTLYRVGIKTGDYTSGTAVVRLSR
jgi:hypothetical protein